MHLRVNTEQRTGKVAEATMADRTVGIGVATAYGVDQFAAWTGRSIHLGNGLITTGRITSNQYRACPFAPRCGSGETSGDRTTARLAAMGSHASRLAPGLTNLHEQRR